MKLKIISWNVNGIRAVDKKVDLNKFLYNNKPHILCLSETKLSCPYDNIEKHFNKKIKGYKYKYWNTCIVKKGYSGTSIWSKKKPINVLYGINNKELDNEGRVITLEFDQFFLINVYTPNSGEALARLNYRVKKWDPAFRKYIKKLQKKKSVIVCGDLNVAHNEIDLANPKSNKKNSGFTDEERNSFSLLLQKNKLVDSYRFLYPDKKDEYSYWTYRFKARDRNKGWRIDYFLTDKKNEQLIKKSGILTKQLGSDHAPVYLEITI
jgi:exodeoxyribonuclease III